MRHFPTNFSSLISIHSEDHASSLITKSELSSWIKASVCTMLSPVVEEHGCPTLGLSYRSICLPENILHQAHTCFLIIIYMPYTTTGSQWISVALFPLAFKYLIKPFMVTVIFVVISHMQMHWRVRLFRLLQEVCIPHGVLCYSFHSVLILVLNYTNQYLTFWTSFASLVLS